MDSNRKPKKDEKCVSSKIKKNLTPDELGDVEEMFNTNSKKGGGSGGRRSTGQKPRISIEDLSGEAKQTAMEKKDKEMGLKLLNSLKADYVKELDMCGRIVVSWVRWLILLLVFFERMR